MLKVSPNAVARLLEILKNSHKNTVLLRVASKGCGGHSYDMSFADPAPGDEIIDLDGERRLAIERKSVFWLFGTVIDCVDKGLGKELVFNNPMETGRCGCGESFSLEPCSDM